MCSLAGQPGSALLMEQAYNDTHVLASSSICQWEQELAEMLGWDNLQNLLDMWLETCCQMIGCS